LMSNPPMPLCNGFLQGVLVQPDLEESGRCVSD